MNIPRVYQILDCHYNLRLMWNKSSRRYSSSTSDEVSIFNSILSSQKRLAECHCSYFVKVTVNCHLGCDPV